MGKAGSIEPSMKTVLISIVLTGALAGCSPSNTQNLQERTADATAAAKRDAGAIARGVSEGLKRKGPLNINTATEADLEKLPGVTPQIAGSVIAKRPYSQPKDLIRKHAMTTAEYNRIKGQIVAE
ncbi:MAG TPA: helix-hairpin-helix domain-containing protein [Acidobacteriaceae bacterium]|nr:helix-hairpin-helix domain-containing protein [Acidobacteriaceae bacterium]